MNDTTPKPTPIQDNGIDILEKRQSTSMDAMSWKYYTIDK
jgi:hypothetical protein